MLQIKDLFITYNKDLRKLIENFNITINQGDKICLIGEEGNGKSTLLKWIYNPELIKDYCEASGKLIINHEKLAYLPQELSDIEKDKTIYEYFLEEEFFLDTNPKDLKIGDDVTYHGSENEFAGLTITHRIINTRYENGKYYFITKGVANTGEDPEISEDNVYGKVIYHTVLFSFVGRLMTNIILYYALFILVGVSFSYEIISTYFIKDDDDDDEKEE